MVKIGVGLPALVKGVKGETILKWAEEIDKGPFSSIVINDRVVFHNLEAVATLAAAAAVTKRVRLMPSILIGSVREPIMLAKQFATLDVLSNGRVTLAIGVGGRADDFSATGMEMHARGKRLERNIESMRRMWRGEPLGENAGVIGPAPVQAGGPPILMGGRDEAALKRAGRIAEGYVAGSSGGAKAVVETVRAAWKEANRPGEPVFKGATYFAFGDRAEAGRDYLRTYYAFQGAQAAENSAGRLTPTPEAAHEVIKTYEDAGFDEVFFWPTVDDIDQVKRLADIVG